MNPFHQFLFVMLGLMFVILLIMVYLISTA